jgi:hypothetical protein
MKYAWNLHSAPILFAQIYSNLASCICNLGSIYSIFSRIWVRSTLYSQLFEIHPRFANCHIGFVGHAVTRLSKNSHLSPTLRVSIHVMVVVSPESMCSIFIQVVHNFDKREKSLPSLSLSINTGQYQLQPVLFLINFHLVFVSYVVKWKVVPYIITFHCENYYNFCKNNNRDVTLVLQMAKVHELHEHTLKKWRKQSLHWLLSFNFLFWNRLVYFFLRNNQTCLISMLKFIWKLKAP